MQRSCAAAAGDSHTQCSYCCLLLCSCCACRCCCACNACLQEMHEFNLEDSSRVAWDPMLKQAWLLQAGKDVEHSAEQLVGYLRRWVGDPLRGCK